MTILRAFVFGRLGEFEWYPRLTAPAVRREKAALSCGCKSHLATAPASSNRSGYGGNDMAEAFG